MLLVYVAVANAILTDCFFAYNRTQFTRIFEPHENQNQLRELQSKEIPHSLVHTPYSTTTATNVNNKKNNNHRIEIKLHILLKGRKKIAQFFLFSTNPLNPMTTEKNEQKSSVKWKMKWNFKIFCDSYIC